MTDGQVLEFSHVTKRFGALTAVDDLSARIEPGAVTAFLGPNGAGKTTSLRMMLGQIRPTSGTATIGGVQHAELRHPLRTIGSVLEEAIYRPRRTAPRQLTIAAKANGIPLSRVDEVLALVGLQNEMETRIGAYSLGMRQRLSVAGALLGDPGALVLDEPANGLDPEGIRWMRMLMRRLADEGRTILVSSHVLSEIEQVADNVLVLSKGRLVYADSIGKLSDPTTGSVIVDAVDRAGLVAALKDAGLSFDVLRSGLTVHNTDAAAVGALAVSAGVALTTLQQRGPSLEEVFLDLVHGRRNPMTGAIPIVGAPAAEAPEDAPEAEEAPAAEGADAPAADAQDAGPTAGLFGAAAAAPVIAAAGAGAAGLFGGATEASASSSGSPIPTTRREAAEFAAAQSADDAARGEDEDAASDEEQAAEGDGDATSEADGSDPAENDATDEQASGNDDAFAGADDAGADDAGADSGEQQPAGDDEATAIAAGVALTAPIDAPGYTPGEAAAEDDGQEPEESAITHAPEGGAQGAALGSFETAALTIPEEARAMSFDELITGVPSDVDGQHADGGQDEPAGEEEPGDEAGSEEPQNDAPTTVLDTTPDGSAEDRNEEYSSPEPSTETTEIAGIEIFAALAEGRTQEIQVILDEAHDDDDLAGEDVTQGEIEHDQDPHAAAVSASLAAAARAFYSDEAPSYTPAPAEEDQRADDQDGERDRGEQENGEQSEHGEQEHGEQEHDGHSEPHHGDEHHGN